MSTTTAHTAPPRDHGDRVVPRAVELAAGTTVAQVRSAALTEPVDLAAAARHRRVALDVVEGVWAAMWQLAAPTAGVLRIPAAQLGRHAGASVAQVNRVIPLLRDFGLISRRGRRRGAWTTTVHALVDAAASDHAALTAAWQRPAAKPISAATRQEARSVAPLSATAPPDGTACPAPQPCDLAAVADVIMPIVGVQVRNHSWQADIAAALELGWSPQQLATELTRDLGDARDVRRVCRHRLMVVIGRVPARHRHCCGQWVQPQPPPGHGERHQPPWLTHLPGQAPVDTAAEGADDRVVAPEVAHNPRETRTTSRKDLLDTHASPPQTPPPSGENATKSTTATGSDYAPLALRTLSADIVAEAVQILRVDVAATAQAPLASRLAAQLDAQGADADDEHVRLDVTLGLVAGTSGTRDPVRVLAWRVNHPDERAAQAARYRAAARHVGGTQLGEPCAAEAFALHDRRLEAAREVRAQRALERSSRTVDLAAERARSEQAARTRRAAADRQQLTRAAAQLQAGAEKLLGRSLRAGAARICGELVGQPAAAIAAVLRRQVRQQSAHVEDLAAVVMAAGVADELLRLPTIMFPAGRLRDAVAGPAQGTAAGPGSLTQAVRAAAPPPAVPPTVDQAAAADLGDIDAAIAAAGVPGTMPAVRRREWAAWLIALRNVRPSNGDDQPRAPRGHRP